MNRVLGRHFHDLGKLMLALVMVWAYFNFSQFLIIYSGNMPEETVWFIKRIDRRLGLDGVGIDTFPFRGSVPDPASAGPEAKADASCDGRDFHSVHAVRRYVLPDRPEPADRRARRLHVPFTISWMDIVAPIAVGGIWLWYFLGQLMSRPLVPVMDPFLENAIEHGHGH